MYRDSRCVPLFFYHAATALKMDEIVAFFVVGYNVFFHRIDRFLELGRSHSVGLSFEPIKVGRAVNYA